MPTHEERLLTRRKILVCAASMATWPIGVVYGQQARPKGALRRVAVLMSSAENDQLGQRRIGALRRGLGDVGLVERSNLELEVRWTGGDSALVRAFAAEIVASAPELIIANGTPVVRALKQATSTIPIIFVVVNDPVAQGFVSNMARPGGNITGFSFLDYSTVAKSLEWLKLMAPRIGRAIVIFNPETYPYYETFLKSFEDMGKALSVQVLGSRVSTEGDIEGAIAGFAKRVDVGLIVPPDPFTMNPSRRTTIIKASAFHRMPAIYFFRDFVREGALMSYGADTVEMFQRSAAYVVRILKGERPGDLPIQAPTRYEMAINLNTAKALGLSIPFQLMAIADEVVGK